MSIKCKYCRKILPDKSQNTPRKTGYCWECYQSRYNSWGPHFRVERYDGRKILDRVAVFLKERKMACSPDEIAENLNGFKQCIIQKMITDHWKRFRHTDDGWELACWEKKCEYPGCKRFCHPPKDYSSTRKYCSREHANKIGKSPPTVLRCFHCGESLAEKYTQKAAEYRVKMFGAVYCGRSCRSYHMHQKRREENVKGIEKKQNTK